MNRTINTRKELLALFGKSGPLDPRHRLSIVADDFENARALGWTVTLHDSAPEAAPDQNFSYFKDMVRLNPEAKTLHVHGGDSRPELTVDYKYILAFGLAATRHVGAMADELKNPRYPDPLDQELFRSMANILMQGDAIGKACAVIDETRLWRSSAIDALMPMLQATQLVLNSAPRQPTTEAVDVSLFFGALPQQPLVKELMKAKDELARARPEAGLLIDEMMQRDLSSRAFILPQIGGLEGMDIKGNLFRNYARQLMHFGRGILGKSVSSMELSLLDMAIRLHDNTAPLPPPTRPATPNGPPSQGNVLNMREAQLAKAARDAPRKG